MKNIVAIDPGIDKCGLLLVDIDLDYVIEGKVVIKDEVVNTLKSWKEKYLFVEIILGDGTSSSYWSTILHSFGSIKLVKENSSTIRARGRYWEIWPPTNILKLVPRGLLLPPEPLDAIAALVFLEDYLGRKLSWKGVPDFKIQLLQ